MSLDADAALRVTSALLQGASPADRAVVLGSIPVLTRPDEPGTPWARDADNLLFVADRLAAHAHGT